MAGYQSARNPLPAPLIAHTQPGGGGTDGGRAFIRTGARDMLMRGEHVRGCHCGWPGRGGCTHATHPHASVGRDHTDPMAHPGHGAPTVGLEPTATRLRALRSAG